MIGLPGDAGGRYLSPDKARRHLKMVAALSATGIHVLAVRRGPGGTTALSQPADPHCA